MNCFAPRLPLITMALVLALADSAQAQQGPPPLVPLGAPPIPTGNPQTDAKIALGTALFWDEQLSRTGTVACGTCHQPRAGGSDPRNAMNPGDRGNPGADGTLGSADDVAGSAGVPMHRIDGSYDFATGFGLAPQVGGRKTPSAINAAFAGTLFWDGRAGATFRDPDTNAVLIADGGALENQALGPIVNSAEMAHLSATLGDITARIQSASPLALAPSVPTALQSFIAGRSYPQLFAEVFGTDEVSASRVGLAIASYERSLISGQAPLDAELSGTPSLTNQERQGLQVFNNVGCAVCHNGNDMSDDLFHYIGVRPANEDLGRFAVTGNSADRGRMKTPSLRNVELAAPYMHNGGFATLEDVIEFYDRGGDFTAANLNPRIRPLNLTTNQKTALAAFLRRPLTDPRVLAETGPFARPTLYTESDRAPQVAGAGRAGTGGLVPTLTALEPPFAGNDNFTVGVSTARAGARATLIIDSVDPGLGATLPAQGALVTTPITLAGSGTGGGFGSVQVALPLASSLYAAPLFGRWYVEDAAAESGIAVSPLLQFSVFGAVTVADSIMLNGFED